MALPEQTERRAGRRRHGIGWCLVFGALLTVGCIQHPSNFPFQSPPENDTDTSPDMQSPDMRSPDMQCVPQGDDALCDIVGAECGAAEARDRCGAMRTLDCGMCSDGGECLRNTCCTPAPEDDLCEGYCGVVTVSDPNCGNDREIDCTDHECPMNEPCNGTTCGGCQIPDDETLCEEARLECGEADEVPDRCGGLTSVTCPECPHAAEACTADNYCVCTLGSEEVCDDGKDNDCDDLVDCEDVDDCEGRVCGKTINLLDQRCSGGTCE